MDYIASSDIKDKNGTFVNQGDIINFSFNGVSAVGIVRYTEGSFFVDTPNNSPLSCFLSQLKELAGDFEVTGNIY